MLNSFIEVLRSGQPVLFDGAMGTELYNRGVFINRCFEEANLSQPGLIKAIHTEYARAGAQVLTTNTWGAGRFKLAGHNLQDRVDEINKRGVSIAREVAGTDQYVAGSIGPMGVRIEPWGPTSFSEARDMFREQASALVDGGVDLIILETFFDVTELEQAVLAVRDVAPDIPLVACMVINTDGQSTIGTPVEWAIKTINGWRVDALGLNCSVGPQTMMAVLGKIKAATNKPIIFQPNAGLPRLVEGRNIYMCSPEYMAEFARQFLREGVQLVGGCCGTTPDHTRAMASAIRQRSAMISSSIDAAERSGTAVAASGEIHGVQSPAAPDVVRVPFAEKSRWAAKLARGERVVSIEVMPPAGVKVDRILAHARDLKAAGIDAINLPDGPRAHARMDPALTAVMIERETGLETILHYTCRDRNLLGMQSSMLGIHAVGLRNLLLITGDPPKMGNYPNATGVFDVDSIGLTNMVHRLNGGMDLGGRSIGAPTALSIGVGVNPCATDFEYELRRFQYKVEAGAEWAITQPVYDADQFLRFRDKIRSMGIKIPIVAGIWPLTSFHNAQFLANEVPGVVIPKAVLDRMGCAKTPEDGAKIGVEIARDVLVRVDDAIQGVAVSAPFGRVGLALAVVEDVK